MTGIFNFAYGLGLGVISLSSLSAGALAKKSGERVGNIVDFSKVLIVYNFSFRVTAWNVDWLTMEIGLRAKKGLKRVGDALDLFNPLAGNLSKMKDSAISR